MSEGVNAWQLIASGDATLFAIVRLSLAVSLSAVAIAVIAGLPLGALLALTRFPGRSAVVVVLNGFMGLPPVVVGLTVYLLLSRSGPSGSSGTVVRVRHATGDRLPPSTGLAEKSLCTSWPGLSRPSTSLLALS